MYSGVEQPVPIRTTAAHIPQQGLVPVPPSVPQGARGTAYRPAAPALRLPGESPYAARIRNARAVQRQRAAEDRKARAGFRGFQQDEANAFQALVDAADASMAGAAVGTLMLGPGLGTSVGAKVGTWAEGLFGKKEEKKR